MARKKYTIEQIIVKLREVDVLCGQGKSITAAARQAEIQEQAYYRWRKKYGDVNIADAKQMKLFEKENTRLRTMAWERGKLARCYR